MTTGAKRAKRVGIVEVAREAGVSTATVSFVLAGKDPVAPQTRQRVLEAVQKLGYTRNRHARALRRGSTPLITAVVPDVTNPFYAELVAAIENAARQRGWLLSLMNCQLDAEREISYLESVFDEAPDGVLYIPMTKDAILSAEAAIASGPPTVILDEITSTATLGAVSVDNAGGARAAARHFFKTGRRRALVTGPPKGMPTSQARTLAFIDEATKIGLEVAHAEFGVLRTSDAGAAAADWLLGDRSIDAYFAGNDFLAMQVLSVLQRAGIRVPDDVAVCGFDGIALGQSMTPRLTTLRQPLDEIAEHAVQILATPDEGRRELILPVEFIQGQST